MIQKQLIQLKLEIDSIKEYLNTEICKTCDEMHTRLKYCQELLEKLQNEKT
jgi:hypothetical protein